MYRIILTGFDRNETDRRIRELAERAASRNQDLWSVYIWEALFRQDDTTALIQVGKSGNLPGFLKGTGDLLIAATPMAAVRELDWLRWGGKLQRMWEEETTAAEDAAFYGREAGEEAYPKEAMEEYLRRVLDAEH